MRATFVNIAKSSTYDYTKVFMMADNVHIENDKEGSVDESEEEDSDIEDDELEVHELDKDILERLEKNDPAVAILSIDLNCNNDKSFFNSIDWEVDGGCIANNTHIKRLNIHIVAPGENYILVDKEMSYQQDSNSKTSSRAYIETNSLRILPLL